MRSLKIGGQVVQDSSLIEEEVINFFGALFNGHHNSDLVDTGQAFIPDNLSLARVLGRDEHHGQHCK